MTLNSEKPLWRPSAQRVATSNLGAFMRAAARTTGAALKDFDALDRWSVTQPEQFWSTLWDVAGVIG